MRTLVIIVVFALAPGIAAAESVPSSCIPGEVRPAVLDIPANLGAFTLVNGYYPSTPPDIRLYQRLGSDDEPRALDVSTGPYSTWTLTPGEPLVEGGVYLLVDTSCPSDTRETRFEVGPAVEFPTTLGATRVSELRATRRLPGPLRYYVRVSLGLSSAAEATTDFVFQGETRADGDSVSRWSGLAYTDAQIYVNCGEASAPVAPGLRTFAHEAQYYGLESLVYSEPAEVDIVCADAVRVDAEDEHPLTPSEIEEEDRVPVVIPGMDSGSGPGAMDGGIDGGLTLSGGGGCRSAGDGTTPSSFAVLLLLSLALVRRARR